MRLAIGVSTILLMFSAVLLAQSSPEEALQKMQDRIAQEKAAAGQTNPASTQPSNLTNAQVAALEKTIARQRDEIDKLAAQVQQLKDKFAMSQLNLRNAQAAIAADAAAGNGAANAPSAADIDTAISQHTLAMGMTVDQCIQSLGSGLGPLNNSFFASDQTYVDPSGKEKYRFSVPMRVNREGDVDFKPYYATFQNGKLVDWHAGEEFSDVMGHRP